MRAIDADALLQTFRRWEAVPDYNDAERHIIRFAIATVEESPTIDPKPKRESRAMLPCKCGCKRKEHWLNPDSDKSEGLKCMRCGFMVWGKNSADVRRKWNEAMRDETIT